MAVLEARNLQSHSSSCSALSLPVLGSHDCKHTDIGVACSPLPLRCAAPAQEYEPLSKHVSTLKLGPTTCDSDSTTVQNGQITPTSPGLAVVKADKTPFPPPLPSAWTWSPENSSGLASLPPTRSDEGPSNWYGSILQSPEELLRCQRCHFTASKPLLSPIKFYPDVEARATEQLGDLPHPDLFEFDDDCHSTLEDVASFHSSDWDLAAPSRRLSYGEPLDMIEARSNHRSIASTELRSKAGRLVRDKQCDTWIDDTLRAQAGRPYDSEPSRRKPRLWLDLVEDDEEVTEAHATAVTTSPSKPRMISIGPRRSDTRQSHGELQSPAKSSFRQGISTFLPETPPQSPNLSTESLQRNASPLKRTAIELLDRDKQARQHGAFNRIRSRTTWSIMTIPPSADSVYWSEETKRQDAMQSSLVLTPPGSRRATPPPSSLKTDIKLSELTTWIIAELETVAAAGDESQALQLDHPVIQQLRIPPKHRKAPRQMPLVPARSSFSAMQGPLSSHSTPSTFAKAPQLIGEPPYSDAKPTLYAPDIALSILTRIFPFAARSTLSHLLAAILAHQFVCTIHTPTKSLSTNSPFAARHISKHSPPSTTAAYADGLPEYIPSKARAMLGLPPPSSPGKPKGGRPPLPSFWRKIEKMEWKERIGHLERELRGMVSRVVRELVEGEKESKSGERWLSVLVDAIGEAVRLGEETGAVTAHAAGAAS